MQVTLLLDAFNKDSFNISAYFSGDGDGVKGAGGCGSGARSRPIAAFSAVRHMWAHPGSHWHAPGSGAHPLSASSLLSTGFRQSTSLSADGGWEG